MKNEQPKPLTPEEKAYLVEVLTAELKHLQRDGKTLLTVDSIKFLESEEKVDEFLTRLINKLK